MLEELLARGVSLAARDSKGRTPLHTAIHHRHVEVAIRLMVESDRTGTVLSARDASGRTPLLLACDRELPQVAMALLDLHVSLDLEVSAALVVDSQP